uniref:PH domain-containing protein n=1 Tax=Globisporangium ultimum (strain ATCC 200006 / CBS 805.95 / DAOM BR144) TaxID=431595 RepID=K3WCJ5_GLOUD
MAHIMDARVMHSMRNSSSTASIDGSRPSSSTGSSGSSRPIRISSRRKSSMSGPTGSSPGGSGSSFANTSSFSALSSSLSRSASMARRPSLSRSSSQSNNTHTTAAASASAAAAAAQKKKKESALATPNLIDLKTISAEEVEWEGYLYKQRKIVKNWTPRYITLQNRTITVYKSKVQALGKEQHRGKWVIKQILSSLPSAGFGGSKLQPDVLGFSFLATNGNLIHFIATSSIGKAMWMHMMQLSLHRGATPETSSMLQMAKPRQELLKTHSTDDIVALEASISKHFADKFYTELLQLLSVSKSEMWIERLPGFLRQLSKDVEILFDLETAEVSQPSCVFKGIYHGREGLVQFASLYASKYLLVMDVNEDPAHRSEDDDHHSYTCVQHALVNTVSGSTTTGKLGLQLSFTPARRVSRIVLSFRQRSSSSSSRSTRRVTFAFDTNRTTFDGVSMADDGWLMRQLQEGAAMRGRLNSAGEDDILDDSECCPVGSEDDTNHPNLYAQDSHSSEEVLSDEGEAQLFSMDTSL